ncbi:thioredoxin domain-containing protein, partial [Candidatus Poribacteria bacterium]|nr:thioredoxin domain-containing protein [Candidatus Poribacteria bacterium]
MSAEHTNRLIDESSPYLLQHAHNPVDWYPWGEEALERARQEDKPVLLSIGYAACHWCHVMERESFEDEEIAALMNRLFVCIKVDREERPDLDSQYMLAVQLMTQQGGWPLNVFLTPDLKPFYGGTYFPPDDRMGRTSFPRILQAVSDFYHADKTALTSRVGQVIQGITRASALSGSDDAPDTRMATRAYNELSARFDTRYGGFGRAPKFPQPSVLDFLIRYASRSGSRDALEMALFTLRKMARGGMYDHLGGGFHRYSVDDRWLVPHFEKMLYDNALLARLCLDAYRITGDRQYADTTRGTLDYVLRDMISDDGAFFASEDADSEGVEGKFYVWSDEEIEKIAGEDAPLFAALYDVSDGGNWEGANILNVPVDPEIVASRAGVSVEELSSVCSRARDNLLDARAKRVRPGLDDKVLASWNGLMIAALAEAGAALDKPRYVDAAARAARFILDRMVTDGELMRSYRLGVAKIPGFLDDYAYVAAGLLDLYAATWDESWLREAARLTDRMIELFWDDETGGFFTTASHHDELVVRMKDSYDGATPSGNAIAVGVLQRLARMTGRSDYASRADETLRLFSATLRDQPTGHAEMLSNLLFALSPPTEIVVVAPDESPMIAEARRRLAALHLPFAVVVHHDP